MYNLFCEVVIGIYHFRFALAPKAFICIVCIRLFIFLTKVKMGFPAVMKYLCYFVYLCVMFKQFLI